MGREEVSLTAYAVRHSDSLPVELTIADNDLPLISFSLSRTEVGEADGPLATVATVTRTPAGMADLLLEVQSSRADIVDSPAHVTLPAGQGSVSFPIAAVDDSVTNTTREVVLTVYPIDPATRRRLSPGTAATLTVTDDEGPSLRVVLARHLVPEGLDPATTATLTRTGDLALPVSVALGSSDPREASVPAEVRLAAGQASAVFDIVSIDDGLSDANQVARISASAPGYASASDTLVVSDLGRPDLVVSGVSGPAVGATEAAVNVSYRIVNQGLTAATTNVLTRVFLSHDAAIGEDTLLGQFDFTGTLPPEQAFEQSLQVRLPVAAGDYWLVVTTDAEDRVAETLEDNNAAIAATPIHVREASAATVAAEASRYLVGAPVLLRGRAFEADSTVPAPHVPVHVHLAVRETRRVLLGVTDDDGNFSVTFQPLPTEAGWYEVAAAHPGATGPAAQDEFTILGFRARPPADQVSLVEQVERVVEIPLENLGDVPLTGLQARVVSAPASLTAITSVTGNGTLAAWGGAVLRLALTAVEVGLPRG